MTSLIACLSTGKGTWTHVSRLIKSEEWEKVFLITNDFGKEKFQPDEKTELIVIDEKQNILEMVKEIKDKLNGKINDIEVAVNLVSGSGKEHMAVISAVLQLGLGSRLVFCDEDKCIEI